MKTNGDKTGTNILYAIRKGREREVRENRGLGKEKRQERQSGRFSTWEMGAYKERQKKSSKKEMAEGKADIDGSESLIKINRKSVSSAPGREERRQ